MRILPLHVHSAFSFLQGTFHPQALVEVVAARAGAGVCLCDWHGLYGMVRLAKAGQERKLYTLCGAELALAHGGSLILYPRDTTGQACLCRLVTRAHLERPRGQPRLSRWPGCKRLKSSSSSSPVGRPEARGASWLAQVATACPGPVFWASQGQRWRIRIRDLLRQWAGGHRPGLPGLPRGCGPRALGAGLA